MRPVRSTRRAYSTSRRRISRLRATLPTGSAGLSEATDRATAFVAIELMNQWVQFSRCLYLSSCRGAFDSAGTRITCTATYKDDNESLRLAANLFKTLHIPPGGYVTYRDEPNWLEPTNLLKALGNVGASNHSAVAAALSLQGRAIRDLAPVRNFFGHRGADTAQKVVGLRGIITGYAVPAVSHPTEFCLSYEPRASRSILGTWLEEIQIIQDFACL